MWLAVGLGILYIMSLGKMGVERHKPLGYSDFYKTLDAGHIKSAVKTGEVIKGRLADNTSFSVYVENGGDPYLLPSLREKVSDFKIAPPKTFWVNLVYSLAPMLLFIAFLWFFVYRNMASSGGKIFSFGKSKARVSHSKKTTFADVAGVDEAKEELQEIIDFLKEPKKFSRLGGKIPKGVLLVGSPGTGKTLLAKAVAGEAGVPFFSISGSDFVEMFVGVGASRVRDLFEQAKKSSTASGKGAIVFIDEIDAVGRQRFAGIGGGNDEREQTLNALLVEMDGFDGSGGVILIAATNRPDVLDPALLRPGRFDRQVVVDRPDIKGREDILNVHVKKIKLHPEVDLSLIARQTPGFSGADLANLVNEGALLSARNNLDSVDQKQLEEAFERIVAGLERKNRVISDEEKKIIAYHESGHAILAAVIPEVDPLHKVSIVSRGTAALGYTMQLPLADKYLKSKTEFLAEITVLMGGRLAEKIFLEEITTGASNDLERATDIARQMVARYGMSDEIGQVIYGGQQSASDDPLGRSGDSRIPSEKTSLSIDNEVRLILDTCYKRGFDLISDYRTSLDSLAKLLLEKEIVTASDVNAIIEEFPPISAPLI
ncbi:cell division protein FtsH [PVC group bacterium (ex Bugula neritina AB1)]|nr:cell division protein FtsH [PVC group bacterium (ex Bugula neritina AB1)]